MIRTGDCRVVMAAMAAAGERVQAVITSPPYWGLRAYGNAACVWGGDPGCPHDWHTEVETRDMRTGAGLAALGERYRGGGHKQGDIGQQRFDRSTCTTCGAWRGELGHETLHDCAGWATGNNCGQCYLCHLREVMRGVWPILADDGVAWINLGDSYAAGNKASAADAARSEGVNSTPDDVRGKANRRAIPGVPAKNLMLMPQRFALSTQADGWIVRRDVVWSKPNAMPESATDRPVTAHEYIWLLAKKRRYYYDADAARVTRAGDEDSRTFRGGCYVHGNRENGALGKRQDTGNVRVRAPAGWDTSRGHGGHGSAHKQGRAQVAEYREIRPGRNLRSVWRIATQPYAQAHYATFPERLVEPMVLASTKPGDVVFDPFAGTGTVAAVAQRLGRRFAGAEINPDNEPLQAQRLRGPLGLAL